MYNMLLIQILIFIYLHAQCAAKDPVITKNCIDKTSKSGACCRGAISIDISLTTITPDAFENCHDITSVDLSTAQQLTSIGDRAFVNCTGLVALIIPNTVFTISKYAFYGCTQLKSLEWSDTLAHIDEFAFSYCENIESELALPQSLTFLGECAFCYCSSLSGTLKIGNALTSISDRAFKGCVGLSGSLAIPNSITEVGISAFYGCGFNDKLYIGVKVATIKDYAFYSSKFEGELTFNSTVLTSIGKGAFEYVKFQGNLRLPSSLLDIGESAFAYCAEFTGDLVIPKAITVINDNIFAYASGFDGAIKIPPGVVSIGFAAFSNCNELSRDLSLPSSLVTIGAYAFSECENLSGKLVLPSSLATVGAYAFQFCSSLTQLSVPSTVTEVGIKAFASCTGMTCISIMGLLTSIASDAFENDVNPTYGSVCADVITDCVNKYSNNGACCYGSIALGVRISSIEDDAFLDCTGITYIDFTSAVNLQAIGKNAFKGCTGVSGSLTIPDTVVSIGDNAFESAGYNGNLIVGDSVLTIGSQCFTRTPFSGSITLGKSLVTIGYDAFLYTGISGTLLLPSSLSFIGNQAFYGCSGLTGTLSFPDSVSYVGANAFDFAMGFTLLSIGSGMTRIYKSSFAHMFALSTITIPSTVNTIEESAFRYCTALRGTLVIPETVTSIGDYAFADNEGLSCIQIINPLTTVYTNKSFDNAVPPVFNTTCPTLVTGCFNKGSKGGRCCSGDIQIAATATSIDDSGFSGCSGITSVDFSVAIGLTYIGDNAFFNCYSITGGLVIADTVTSIGNNAFDMCIGFTGSLSIGNNVTSIGTSAFSYCGFEGTLTIGDAVTAIGSFAFYQCSKLIGDLITPPLVTVISPYAFYMCKGLTGNLTLGTAIASIGDGAFKECGFTGALVIPTAVTSIGAYAFYVSKCVSLTLGSNIASIGEYAFIQSSFAGTLILPSSIQSIGSYAFASCFQLTCISVLYTDAVIGDEVFNGDVAPVYGSACAAVAKGCYNRFSNNGTCCSGAIKLARMSSIEDYAFKGCAITSIDFNTPDLIGITTVSLASIGVGAFEGCRLLTGSLTIPNTVSVVGASAFYNCTGLSGNLIIGSSVQIIGDSAFAYCTGFQGNLMFYGSVLSIGSAAFKYATLTGPLFIPVTVGDIGSYAFAGGLYTSSLVIPSSVTRIGAYSFSGCIYITCIQISNADVVIEESAFEGTVTPRLTSEECPTTVRLVVDCYNKYSQDGRCCSGDIQISASATSINDYDFFNCYDITSVDFSVATSLTSIGEYAFAACTSATGSLTLPDSITSIGPNAFRSSGFDGVLSLPPNVIQIGSYAFYECSFTDGLSLPDTVTNIGQYTFAYCSGFTGEIAITDNIVDVGSNAFYECTGFTRIYLGNSLTRIGSEAFAMCTGLTGSLTIPSQVTGIDDGAFRNDTSLACISIMTTNVVIGEDVFLNTVIPQVGVICPDAPSSAPIAKPTTKPSSKRTDKPTALPTLISSQPPSKRTDKPTALPTLIPSRTPTQFPTLLPTEADASREVVTFDATMTQVKSLSNVLLLSQTRFLADSINANTTAYDILRTPGVNETMCYAIAAVMDLQLSEVSVTDLKVSTSPPLPIASSVSSTTARSLAKLSYYLEWTISFAIQRAYHPTYTSSDALYTYSTSLFADAINSNDFDAAIATTATAYGFSIFDNTVTSAIDFTPATIVNLLVPYVYTTVGINISKSGIIAIVVIGFVATIVMCILTFGLPYKQQMLFILISLLCIIDGLSDLTFFFYCDYYHYVLLTATAVFLLLPSIIFLLHTLIQVHAHPHLIKDMYFGHTLSKNGTTHMLWFWLSHNRGLPLVNGKKQDFSFENHDSLPKLFVYVVTWAILVVLQLVTLVPFFIYLVILTPFYLLLFFVGAFLSHSKLLCTRYAWNVWMSVYSFRVSKYNKVHIIDTWLLNEALFFQIFICSLPQSIIKAINISLLLANNSTNTLAFSAVSLAISVAMVLFGVIRYFGTCKIHHGIIHEPKFYLGSIELDHVRDDVYASYRKKDEYYHHWMTLLTQDKISCFVTDHLLMHRKMFFSSTHTAEVSALRTRIDQFLDAFRNMTFTDLSPEQAADEAFSIILLDRSDNTSAKYLKELKIYSSRDLMKSNRMQCKSILHHIHSYRNAKRLHILLKIATFSHDEFVKQSTFRKMQSKFRLEDAHDSDTIDDAGVVEVQLAE